MVEHRDQHHKAGDDQAGKRIGAALGELDIGRRAGEHIIRMTGIDEAEAEVPDEDFSCCKNERDLIIDHNEAPEHRPQLRSHWKPVQGNPIL